MKLQIFFILFFIILYDGLYAVNDSLPEFQIQTKRGKITGIAALSIAGVCYFWRDEHGMCSYYNAIITCLLVYGINGLYSLIDAPINSHKINKRNKERKTTQESLSPYIQIRQSPFIGNNQAEPILGLKLSVNF